LWLAEGETERLLPEGCLPPVFEKFAVPLAEDVALEGDAMELPGELRLTRFRYRPRFDVIARDYLALERPGREPRAALGPTIAGALRHLATALALSRQGS
jgi:hypothetical protein